MQTSINFVPIGDRILVLRDRPVQKLESGVIIPEAAQDLPVEGSVIALGTAHEDGLACPVKIGDRVTFTEYTGQVVKTGEKADTYLVMRPDELLGRARR